MSSYPAAIISIVMTVGHDNTSTHHFYCRDLESKESLTISVLLFIHVVGPYISHKLQEVSGCMGVSTSSVCLYI